MSDIKDRADIVALVNTFYAEVRQDDTIGFIFNNIIGSDWTRHLPVMYQFWESVLFQTGGYVGHPIAVHIQVNQKITLTSVHFDRWLLLWRQAVARLFEGPMADAAILKAGLMVTLMQSKIDDAKGAGFIQ